MAARANRTSPRLSEDAWDRYWRAVNRFAPEARSPADLFFDRVIEDARPGKWFDAGCGRRSSPAWRQTDLQKLLASGVEVYGCDLDRSALRERCDPGHVCAGSLDHTPFRSGSFDLITANMVFEHLENPDAVVRELVRVAAPGGRILIHTVNARHYLAWVARVTPQRFHEWIVGRIEGRAAKDVYPTRYRANTPEILRALFTRHGYRCRWGGEITGIPIHVPYPVVFWLAIVLGLLERALARTRQFHRFLSPNLLIEFEPVGLSGELEAACDRRAETRAD